MGLFHRIFHQPPTSERGADENLTTEILAYFLETLEPLRRLFLLKTGVKYDPHDEWVVDTQRRLIGEGDWAGRIPDLWIERKDKRVLVLVEVKIDASTTYRGNVPQTRSYWEYLQYQKASRHEPLEEGRLVVLSRWSPERALAGVECTRLRFRHVAEWLDAAATEASTLAASLAREWGQYLRERRWAMPKLEQRHIDALVAMSELLPQLWDFVARVTREAVETGGWTRRAKGKASAGALKEAQQAVWAAPIQSKTTDQRTVQVGCAYGSDSGKPMLRAVLQLNGWQSMPRLPEDSVVEQFSGGPTVLLKNMVPHGTEGGDAEQVWDTMTQEVREVLAELRAVEKG